MNESLFEPSLARVAQERPLYSTTTLFMAAFFGGSAAAALVFGVNAHRAERLKRDAGVLLLVLAAGLALPFVALSSGAFAQPSDLRIPLRVGGLLLAALLYWRHRSLYRGQDLFGVQRPNGFGLGLGAIVAGGMLNFFMLYVALAAFQLPGDQP